MDTFFSQVRDIWSEKYLVGERSLEKQREVNLPISEAYQWVPFSA